KPHYLSGTLLLIRFSTIAALMALGLSACTPAQPQLPPSGQPVALSPATQGEVTAYLQRVKVTRPGAFAVSPDGRNSFYTWRASHFSVPGAAGVRGPRRHRLRRPLGALGAAPPLHQGGRRGAGRAARLAATAAHRVGQQGRRAVAADRRRAARAYCACRRSGP